jgi:hypothetical protein
MIERQLQNADKALGRNDAATTARPCVTSYALDLLNVESRFEVPRIVEALRRKGAGQMCFYGPPGTGKSGQWKYPCRRGDCPAGIDPGPAS